MKTLYGLPEKVEFCKRCVISNQRPSSVIEQKHTRDSAKKTIGFAGGVCDACRMQDKKAGVDWAAREEELMALCDKHRRRDRYDCLVPGSGGKDSFMQAHLLKYKYGMHPLTVTWAPHMHTDWGWRNFQAWIHAGFDNILVTPNGRVHRLLTRLATDTLLHPFQPFIVGQRHLAAKAAALRDIKLVFYGESGAEYGNAPDQGAQRDFAEYEHFSASGDADIYLGGVSFEELKGKHGLTPLDLSPYLPIDPQLCREKGIEVHYLGHYVKWHPQAAYYYAVEHGGFQAAPERTPGTYSKYNSIDDKMDDLHYFTTFIKFGIGRATYDAAQEIRSGDLTRSEGAALVKRYDGEYPARFEREVFDYLNVDGFPCYERASFLRHCEEFKSPHLWDGDKLRHTVYA